MTAILRAALTFAAGLTICAQVQAQAWPSKPVRIILPFAAGGSSDLVLRPLASALQPVFGQPFVIDPKPGAATAIAADALAKSAPDGYTVGLVTDLLVYNTLFRKELPYDPFKDFAPITRLVEAPMILATSPAIPAKTLPQLVSYAKANPGKLAYAALGVSSPQYLGMEWLKRLAGIDMLAVQYSGVAPAATAVVGGQVQLLMAGPQLAIPYGQDGRLNLIATATPKRLPFAPNLPTIAELGYEGFGFSNFFGMAAPAKTPPDIVNRLSREIGRALTAPEMVDRMNKIYAVVSPNTPEEFAANLRDTLRTFEQMIKIAGVKIEKE